MPYNFTDATLLSYSINNNFLGEGLFSLNSKKNISIRGILDNRFSNLKADGVKESIQDITNIKTGAFDVYEAVFINGYNLGTGKIISVSFPTNNPIRIGEYQYDIEITNLSDLSYAGTDDVYGSYLLNLKDNLLTLDENFNFDYQTDGKYKYSHNVNVQYQDDNSTDIILKSKNLAFNLFNENISLGLINPFSGSYKDFINKKNYYTEVYNTIDKACSFTKEITIDPNNNSNYSLDTNHNLSYDTNGKIRVQENGTILGLNNSLAFTAENYFNDVLSNSYSRCQNLLSFYSNKYALQNYDNLYNKPFEIGRIVDPFSNKLQYSVSYVNDISFEGNVINNYTIAINQNDRGTRNYVENGQITQVGQLGDVTGLNIFKIKYDEAKTRAINSYPSFKLLNQSFTLSKVQDAFNNSFSYVLEKTDDGSILEGHPSYKSLNIKIDDRKPTPITREYIIANKLPKNILFLYGNNIEIGEKNISIEGILNRSTSNHWNHPISLPLDDLKALAISNGLDLISDEAYIDNISYQYTSENTFSFIVSIKYLKKLGE